MCACDHVHVVKRGDGSAATSGVWELESAHVGVKQGDGCVTTSRLRVGGVELKKSSP